MEATSNDLTLTTAVQQGKIEAVRRLSSVGARVHTDKGWSPVFTAAHGGHDKTIEIFVNELGMSATAPDQRGQTPLHMAAHGGQSPTCENLVRTYGANPNATNVYGETPLHAAARQGHDDTVRTLVSCGADPGAKDGKGFTALHGAVAAGKLSTMKVLISEFFLKVDDVNDFGDTSVHLAALQGHNELLKVLSETYCAKLTEKNNQGLTPSQMAGRNGHEQTAVLLEQLGGGSLEKFHLCPYTGKMQNVDSILDRMVQKFEFKRKVKYNETKGLPAPKMDAPQQKSAMASLVMGLKGKMMRAAQEAAAKEAAEAVAAGKEPIPFDDPEEPMSPIILAVKDQVGELERGCFDQSREVNADSAK